MAEANLQLFLLGAERLLRCRWDGRSENLEILNSAMDGETVREVARDPFNPNKLYAATLTEIHVSENHGDSWQWLPSGGIDYRDIWTMAVHPTRPNEIYVGTLPAAVYVSDNGGRSFRELSAFRNLPDYNKWTFPPGAHVAHARSIALDARVPDEIIVGIEEGGVARSRDRGATWEDISGPASPTAFPKINDPAGIVPYEMGRHEEGRVYRDVHWVTRHPTRLETLFASTGIGTYRTDDNGKNWTKCEYGLGRAYAIPMTNHPAVPDRIFLGAAENGPATWAGYRTVRAGPYNTVKFSRNATAETGGAKTQILRSDDAGNTWSYLKTGLPAGTEHMTCGFASHPQDPNTLCVGYTDGSVYASNDAGQSWRRLIVSLPKLYGLRLIPSV
ncbi:MAG: WD40/YVTN/BNR-like repeat-containing protein [Candidatus Binatia bacterium]